MFPASTKGGGTCAIPGPMDACKTPTPGGPVPMPYPNIAQVAQADGSSCSDKVKISGDKACTMKTEITMSSGDEPGCAGGGVVSNKIKGEVTYKKGSGKVKAEGEFVVFATSMTAHNGKNANVPAGGVQVAPSQTKVMIGS